MPDLSDYLNSRHEPQNVNLKHRQSLKLQDRLALIITAAIGSMYAVYALTFFVCSWMWWQSSSTHPFDPFPYVFMIFISNILQLILLPLILVGQNIANRHAQLRAEEEYQTTKTILKDIEKILTQLPAKHRP